MMYSIYYDNNNGCLSHNNNHEMCAKFPLARRIYEGKKWLSMRSRSCLAPSHFCVPLLLHRRCIHALLRTHTAALFISKLISYFTDDGRWEHGRVVMPAMLAIYDARTLYLHLAVRLCDERIIVD